MVNNADYERALVDLFQNIKPKSHLTYKVAGKVLKKPSGEDNQVIVQVYYGNDEVYEFYFHAK